MAAPKTGPTAKKRAEDRLGHRTKAEQAREDVIQVGPDEPPVEDTVLADGTNLGVPDYWHKVAVFAWNAFCESPLRRFYENTDYVHAWVTCELIHKTVTTGMGPGMAMQLRMYLNDLGFTEGARRSMDVAIRRETEVADPEKVVAKERLAERRAARGR